MPLDPFRMALLLFLTPLLAAALFFRLRSHSREKLDRRQEGLFILIALRLSGLLMWGSLFAWIFRPGSLAWAAIELPAWSRWTGFAAAVVAAGWVIWVFRTLGHNLTDTVVTRSNATLVTSGPYRYVRNPLYAAIVPLAAGISLLTAQWFTMLLAAFALVLLVIRTRKEEANLIARFGDAYRSYMRATPRLIPWLPRSHRG